MHILFQNSDFIIVDKPHGIEFHSENGLVDQIRKVVPDALGVHRLDKDTSGLMIFALNKNSQSKISKLFETKHISKTYMAISDKKPKKKMGNIIGDLTKGRGGSYYLLKTKNNPSLTKFISKKDEDTHLRCFVLRPLNGKTHQLRVVLKSLGASIIGDDRYGNTASDRMYLHSYMLEFEYKNKKFKFEKYPDQGELFNRKSVYKTFEELLQSDDFKILNKKRDR